MSTPAVALSRPIPRPLLLVGCYLAVLIACVAPIWSVQIPPLTDYPNHLSRFILLLKDAAGSEPHPYYTVVWAPLPNIAGDVVVVLAGQFMPVEDAGRFLLSLSLGLWLVGIATLHAALFGRVGLWPLAATPFLYNIMFTLGLVNYYLGAGLLLFALALAVHAQVWPARKRVPALCAAAIGLYFCHLIILLVFGASIALLEIHRLWQDRAAPARWIAAATQTALPFVPPLVLLLAYAPPSYLADTDLAGEPLVSFGTLANRLSTLRNVVNADLGVIDTVLWITLGGAGLILVCTRALVLSKRFKLVILGLLIIVAFVPVRIAQETGIHHRLPSLLVCLAIAATNPVRARICKAAATALIIAGFVSFMRLAVLVPVWIQHDSAIAEFRTAVAHLPPGSRILPALARAVESQLLRAPSHGWKHYLQLAQIAVADIDAYSPLFFCVPGQQPIQVKPEVLSPCTGGPATLQELFEAAAGLAPSRGRAYLISWPERFDYLAVLGEPVPGRLKIAGGLEPEWRGDRFAIFRLRPRPEDAVP